MVKIPDDIDRIPKMDAAISMHFKTAVDLSTDAIGISTAAGRHWYQNRAFTELFGDIGDDPPARLYVDERVGRKVFATVMAGDQWSGEVKMHAKDGRILTILLRAYAIKDDRGTIAGLVGAHTDITELKRAETLLRERDENLRAMLAASPGPLVMYDVAGTPTYLNPRFTEVFGWTLEELKGQRIPFVPEDQVEKTQAHIQDIYRTLAASEFETRRYTKDGRTLDVIINAAIMLRSDGNPAGMVVNLTDITEVKLLNAQYLQAQKMESLGTLAGGIAHDFNNLLMGIQGRASLMALDLTPNHPHYEHVKGIETYVRSASELTAQLLGFARGGKYEVLPIDLNELVQTTSDLFWRTKKEIAIHSRLCEAPLVVEADPRQLKQVLLNIFVNAWQAMPDGGSLFIETHQERIGAHDGALLQVSPGPFAKIAIADTGTGMDQATLERIFDPFFTTKEKSRGTGLGLASAFGIIKNHKGVINASSRKGQGSIFTILLPLSNQAAIADNAPEDRFVRGRETILLVDDEDLILEVGRSLLSALGYTVISAKNGQEALEILSTESERIDLIILDLIMPGMDGARTFERIHTRIPKMKVLLSSGYSQDEQTERLINQGCCGFIHKPFTLNELSAKLRSILDQR